MRVDDKGAHCCLGDVSLYAFVIVYGNQAAKAGGHPILS